MSREWLFSYGYIIVDGVEIENKTKLGRDITFFVSNRIDAFSVALSILKSVVKEQKKAIVFYRASLRHGKVYYKELDVYQLKNKYFETEALVNAHKSQVAKCFQATG